VNAAKKAVLAAVTNDETRAALATFPGAYFQVAVETVDDPDDLTAVLWRVVELYSDAVEQTTRRADAVTARLAEQRRHGLHIIHPPDTPATTEPQVKGTTQ
jgi:hypothetical protein